MIEHRSKSNYIQIHNNQFFLFEVGFSELKIIKSFNIRNISAVESHLQYFFPGGKYRQDLDIT